MKKGLFFGVFFLLFLGNIALSQNNVGIGTTTPHASAVLDLTASDKGLLIPRVNLLALNNGTSPISSPANGLLVYNQGGALSVGFYYWSGTEWVLVGAGGSSAVCGTLNDAYNCGGNGAGRNIAANYGALEVTLSSGSTLEAITAITSVGTVPAPTAAIGAYNTKIGGSLYAENTNPSNPYNTIEGATNSNNEYTSAVGGYYLGTGPGVGVYGNILESTTAGIAGVMGVNFRSNGGHGVLGQGVNGVVGITNNLDGYGVYGANNAALGAGEGPGVYGIGQTGVFGQTEDGDYYGVFGGNLSTSTTADNIGVAGIGWAGVVGESNDPSGYGIYSLGNLSATGTKSFVIDHPLDPDNKFLKHYCAESPEVLNIYRGNVIVGANGEAIVELPDYFSEININFSYYLTPIGAAAPQLYVKEEVKNNKFVIAGGVPNMKVSWVLYAERNDPYVRNNPDASAIEPDKRQKGTYIHPEFYNKPIEKSMILLNNKKLEVSPIPTEVKSNTSISGKLKK